MQLFIVIQDGVYRHDIWGVYATEVEARRCAITSLEAEGDDYHTADIIRMTLGEPGETPVCTYTRKDTRGKPKERYGRGDILSSQITVKDRTAAE